MVSIPVIFALVGSLFSWIESLFVGHGYLIVAALVAGESAGLPLPGETSLLAGAVEAQRGKLDIVLVIAVAAAAAIIGDNIGYLIGRRAGRPALERYGRLLRIRERQIAVLDYYFERHGAKTVFFGRWVALLRVAAALSAGASRMPWRRFFLWNALGGAMWATSVGLLGFAFAGSVKRIDSVLGVAGIIALVAATAALILFIKRTERRLVAETALHGEEPGRAGRPAA